MIEDGVEWPEELCFQPQPLVGVIGLELINPAHKTIWDALISTRRLERAPVQFKLLTNITEFPPVKPKRNSYEWYIPKGILKKNWMKKHLTLLPAVVVIFFELDWDDDAHWAEKRSQCTSLVQAVRSSLDGRNTRIAVVLLQQKASSPTGEDIVAAERAAALCNASEINQKSLFVLPHGDHLHGYTLRLENAFYELAQSYYQAEIRHIKSHREHLNKTTHQYLFVRHQFKMGFLNEMRQDLRSAHGHYSAAYTNLQDLRLVDTNALEVKTVAGFLVYKQCRLMFTFNQAREAIQQYRSHVDYFLNKIGPKELAFEHYAWLSKGSSVFGDLFDEAIRVGLEASQTQHPGFYYEQAARHSVTRKQLAANICQGVDKYPDTDPLAGINTMEFYGQRPWRPGKLSVEPPDLVKERDGVIALQYKEKYHCNHSLIIITHIGNAISQYKTYNCPRMRRCLVVQMADEYCSSKDYGKALTLLSHMLWDYRNERWWMLFSCLLSKALYCAYLTASIKEYIEVGLEAMSQFSQERQVKLFNNILAVIKKSVPDPEPNIDPAEIEPVLELWKTRNSDVATSLITIKMKNIDSCIDCKAKFVEATCSSVDIQLFIKSRLECSVQFRKLSVSVSSPTVSSEFAVNPTQSSEFPICEGSSDSDPRLLFAPGEVKTYTCQYVPNPQDVGKEIQIEAISLELGGGPGERKILLQFTGHGCEPANPYPELLYFRRGNADTLHFDTFVPITSTIITARVPQIKLNVEQETPALQGAWHSISVLIENAESIPIDQAILNVSVRPSLEDPSIEQNTEMCETIENLILSLPMTLTLGALEAGSSLKKTFLMKSLSLPTRNLILKVSYRTDKNELCEKEHVMSVSVVKALEMATSFLSTRFEPINKLYAREPFVISMRLDCISPWPIVVHKTELVPYVCQLKGTRLKNGESGTCISSLIAKEPSEKLTNVGTFAVHWCLEGSDPSLVTSTTFGLPEMHVSKTPLLLDMVVPSHGRVRTPLPVSYVVRNNTATLLSISLAMEPSDAFILKQKETRKKHPLK
ncbi:hypothetical protein LSTR_LSTR011137 [Laodelphax striatellus]|uniref:Trafficking protein particle complex subunit 11 domain-containing protein n=1 Tax=Laodelphax striatellus TaxID=195883 RepID=A0A482X2H4_LAOST|nr:hypothetical protein LSTR_LSTR011137 [Laodelphax striatellus]